MDNFLFIVPFVFLAGVGARISSISRLRIVMLTSLLYIPIVFAPFVYSHQNVYGLFYWFYPLIHFNGPPVDSLLISNILVPSYNLLFMLLLYISITISLFKSNLNQHSPENSIFLFVLPKMHKNNFKFKKLFAILILVVLMSIPISFIYNYTNNSISVNTPDNFPLLYFYPESHENSSICLPTSNDSYSIHNNVLSIPSTMPTLRFRITSNNGIIVI